MSTHLEKIKNVFLKAPEQKQLRVLQSIRMRDAFIVMAHQGVGGEKKRMVDIADFWEISVGQCHKIERKVWLALRHPERWAYIRNKKRQLSMRPFYRKQTHIPWT